jgi:hypothetical protein
MYRFEGFLYLIDPHAGYAGILGQIQVNLGAILSFTIFATLIEKRCPDGEIGRRTVFRSQRGKPCVGSNPILGTKPSDGSRRAFLFGSGASLLAIADKRKRPLPRSGRKALGTPLVEVERSAELILFWVTKRAYNPAEATLDWLEDLRKIGISWKIPIFFKPFIMRLPSRGIALDTACIW